MDRNPLPENCKEGAKNADWSGNLTPHPAGHKVYEVMSNEVTYIVEMNMRACSCRRWQLTGIPCSHVLACAREERIKAETLVSP